jgi:hypothetical protein
VRAGKVWCCRCKARTVITGPEQVSPNGIIRVRGACPCCGQRLKALVGVVTP